MPYFIRIWFYPYYPIFKWLILKQDMERREIYGKHKINIKTKEEKLLENANISLRNKELIKS